MLLIHLKKKYFKGLCEFQELQKYEYINILYLCAVLWTPEAFPGPNLRFPKVACYIQSIADTAWGRPVFYRLQSLHKT